MKRLPIHSFPEDSSEEIEKQVKLLLSAVGVKDQLPTPKEDVIACAKLVEIGEIDLSRYEERWSKRGVNFLKGALSKIKGLLDFKEKIIYVNPNLHHSKETFVTYHEVTHRILPWHAGLYNPHTDNNYSIDPRTATGLEMEANVGAALIQFQIDRFAKELRDLPVGLGSALHLAERYETSLHSTFRKYVEDNHRACALLVLELFANGSADHQQMLKLWYPLQSDKFTMKFGKVDWEKFYCPGHPVYDTVFSESLESVKTGEIVLIDLWGFKTRCRIEALFNTFNHFVLIYPIPRLSSRTKIEVVGN